MHEPKQLPPGGPGPMPRQAGLASLKAPRTSGTDRGVHLLDRFAVVVKYYKAVGTVFVLVVSGWMYQTYTTTPLYRAQTRLQIEEERSADTSFKETYAGYQDPEPYYQTQYRVLQGRDLARRAVRRLDLGTSPEFNGSLDPPSRFSRAIELLKARVVAPFTGGGTTPEPVAPPPSGAPDENSLVAAFQSRVQVVPVRSSRLVDVSFTSADAEFAARAVNVLAEEYVQQNLEFRLENTQKMLAWLEQEVGRQQGVVETSERELAAYRERKNALSLDDRQDIVVSRLNQVNEAVTKAKTQRVQRETAYRQISEAKDRESLTSTLQNPFIQTLKGRLAELQRDRARLLDRYGEKHPQVQNVTSQIADTERQIDAEIVKTVQSVRSAYEAALAEERTLAAELEAQKAAALDLNRKGVDYSLLQRQAESNRQVYESLLQREKELRVVANSRANNVRVLDRAEVPGAPFTPDVSRAWMLALLLGLGAGVAAAFAIDYLDDTVKTPDDITRRLRLHLLGIVPKVRGRRHPLLSGPVPHDFGEAFRALRTALVANNPGGANRIVAVTSAQPLEGKTTTAANIALALAIGGGRVLLIDADMRRPSLHKALRLPNDKGLSDLLGGEARMRDVVQRTSDPNLLVVTAGHPPTNPSELLSSDRMKAFVHQLGVGPFDWVIIDTPPVLAVTDAVILAPIVSSVTFVLGAEMTRWHLAERAIELVMSGHPQAVSAVLNQVDYDRNRYYYSRYYGHQHRSYYAEAPATG